jgi:hypothetical protein
VGHMVLDDAETLARVAVVMGVEARREDGQF